MDQLDLGAIQARTDAATGGDWRYEAYAGLGKHGVLGAANIPIGRLDFGDGDQADADRDFVLNAHRDVAALLARVRQLEAQLAEHREKYGPRCEWCEQPMTEPNGAGWWICTPCGDKNAAKWAGQPDIPF
ncbi:hypothetical protein [Kitasatospora sp. NPDC127116]|uniref:hypothetical protein n=1 Tax=Kitasatospora sp. NPDC127116 TaxID=3345367 RepID=UPI00363B23B4